MGIRYAQSTKEHEMVNKSKDIGTHGESAVVKQLKPFWPDATRNALRGSGDIGDISGCGMFMFEVKSGNTAKTAGTVLLERWLLDTERERKMAGTRFGILVMQRSGFGYPNADRWWAVLNAAAFADIMGAPGHVNASPIRLELGDLLGILADQGFTADTPDAAA